MKTEKITEHGYQRMKERVGIKNIEAMERMIDLALLKGDREETTKSKFAKDLAGRLKGDNVYIIIYNSYYFVMSKFNDALVTVYPVEKDVLNSFYAYKRKMSTKHINSLVEE